MNVVFKHAILFCFLFEVSLLVLVQNDILHLESLLCICVSLIEYLETLGKRFSVICNERFSVDIGRRKMFFGIQSVHLLVQSPLLLVLLLLMLIVVLSKHGIIVVSFPILVLYFSFAPFHFLLQPFFVCLAVDVGYDIVLFGGGAEELLFLLLHQFHFAILEVEFRHLLVVNDVEGIADWAEFAGGQLFGVRLVGLQIDDIEVFLVLDCVPLHFLRSTRWLTRDFALFSWKVKTSRSSSSWRA